MILELHGCMVFFLYFQNKDDRTIQKKAYRALEEICASKSENSRKFVKQHLEALKQLLSESLSTSNPSSKAVSVFKSHKIL